ncbi:hypothetical protein PR202_ga08785 [Eleusine coracana subsp. coracana]|uniref:Uncharacterized protein n=1 Tax=Eleusine coracana subsp. coracana TaxID=191504 RepID=A0AAV5C3I2_ELECO|nr:hypothetical protein PR202_ga08785 [Eleusine coracana subsp. coracana]
MALLLLLPLDMLWPHISLYPAILIVPAGDSALYLGLLGLFTNELADCVGRREYPQKGNNYDGWKQLVILELLL